MDLGCIFQFGEVHCARPRIVHDAKVQIVSILLPKTGKLGIFLQLAQQMVGDNSSTLGRRSPHAQHELTQTAPQGCVCTVLENSHSKSVDVAEALHDAVDVTSVAEVLKSLHPRLQEPRRRRHLIFQLHERSSKREGQQKESHQGTGIRTARVGDRETACKWP